MPSGGGGAPLGHRCGQEAENRNQSLAEPSPAALRLWALLSSSLQPALQTGWGRPLELLVPQRLFLHASSSGLTEAKLASDSTPSFGLLLGPSASRRIDIRKRSVTWLHSQGNDFSQQGLRAISVPQVPDPICWTLEGVSEIRLT